MCVIYLKKKRVLSWLLSRPASCHVKSGKFCKASRSSCPLLTDNYCAWMRMASQTQTASCKRSRACPLPASPLPWQLICLAALLRSYFCSTKGTKRIYSRYRYINWYKCTHTYSMYSWILLICHFFSCFSGAFSGVSTAHLLDLKHATPLGDQTRCFSYLQPSGPVSAHLSTNKVQQSSTKPGNRKGSSVINLIKYRWCLPGFTMVYLLKLVILHGYVK